MITRKWILDYAYAPDDWVLDPAAIKELLNLLWPSWREVFHG